MTSELPPIGSERLTRARSVSERRRECLVRKVFRRSTALLVIGLAAIAALAVVSVVATATASTKTRRRACRSASCCRTRSRPSAGCSSTRLTFKAAFEGGRRHGVDQQRPQRPAEAEGAGAGVPRCRREGRHRDGARQRLRRVDREAVHLEGRQGDRLRPPGHRRHRLRLRHVRRQGGRRRRRRTASSPR